MVITVTASLAVLLVLSLLLIRLLGMASTLS
jgi:hypothetical protein